MCNVRDGGELSTVSGTGERRRNGLGKSLGIFQDFFFNSFGFFVFLRLDRWTDSETPGGIAHDQRQPGSGLEWECCASKQAMWPATAAGRNWIDSWEGLCD